MRECCWKATGVIRFGWLIPSPDGKYAALAVDTGESNVWMVENY